MRAPWLTWVWPIIILLSTLAVALITFLFPTVGIRPVVIMCFLFLIPGITVVRFFRTGETAVEWMFAIALSFAIDAFVDGIILYARQWSPTHIMSFLIGFCFGGAIAQLALLRPASAVAEPMSSHSKDRAIRFDFETQMAAEHTENFQTTIDAEGIKNFQTTIATEDMEDPEDTKELPAVSLQSHQSLLEMSQEKTVPLEKPELSGKEV